MILSEHKHLVIVGGCSVDVYEVLTFAWLPSLVMHEHWSIDYFDKRYPSECTLLFDDSVPDEEIFLLALAHADLFEVPGDSNNET